MPSTRARIFANAVSRRGPRVVGERREAAVVGRPELGERDVLGGEEDAIPDDLRRLHLRIDRVGDADEDALIRLQARGDLAEHRFRVALAGQLEVEGARVEIEQSGQQARVVDVGAVGRVVVAAGARVHADPLALLGREAVEHAVVQVDEAPQQAARRVELQRQPRLGEVDLDVVGARVEAAADVGLRLVDQIRDERVPRVAVDPVGGIEQAQRRGRDHRLLDRLRREALRRAQIAVGMRCVAERAGRDHRKLPRVAVGERDHNAVRGECVEPCDRVGGKARLGLLAVGDHRRAGRLERGDRVAHCLVEQLVEREPRLHGGQQLGWARDAPDRFGWNRHRSGR